MLQHLIETQARSHVRVQHSDQQVREGRTHQMLTPIEQQRAQSSLSVGERRAATGIDSRAGSSASLPPLPRRAGVGAETSRCSRRRRRAGAAPVAI